MSFTKNDKATSLTLEAVSYLVGLIRDINGLDTNLIDDINKKTNGTFSSVHIDNLIDKCLKDANTHAEAICNALTKLTAQKTTVQPTLSNSELNVIYLYSSDGNAPFDQYLKISDTELIDMGSTSISLTDYLTATQIANDYAKKVDLNALITEVNKTKTDITTLNTNKEEKSNKVTTLNSTSTDTQYPSAKVTYDGLNNKVDKTSIITTFDNTAIDEQIFSAKAVYDNTITCELHHDNSDYNIDTLENYVATHVHPATNGETGTFPTEFDWGTFIQFPAKDYRTQILISTQGMYYRIMKGGKWQPWYKVNATEITDTTVYPKETT